MPPLSPRGVWSIALAIALACSAATCAGGSPKGVGTPAGGATAPVSSASDPASSGDRNRGQESGGTVARSEHAATLAVPATLRAVRVSNNAGAQRVVFEFAEALPGYVVEYAGATPAACGSGKPVDAGGEARLTVRLSPARAHAEVGEAAPTVAHEHTLGAAGTGRLVLTCDFEGVVSWALGLDGRRPYQLSTIEQPPRLVLDIAVGRDAAADAPR